MRSNNPLARISPKNRFLVIQRAMRRFLPFRVMDRVIATTGGLERLYGNVDEAGAVFSHLLSGHVSVPKAAFMPVHPQDL